MITTNERTFNGGTLVVTDVPMQKCQCDDMQINDQILLGDGALIAGYARLLANSSIIGQVTVSLSELKGKYSLQDFLSKGISH